MGYSIGRVFKPIEEEMKKYAEVDSVYLPMPNYSLRGLWKNIRAARNAIRQKQYDIVHITGAEHYLIPFLKGQRVVVTVHDINKDQLNCSIKGLWRRFMWVKTLPFADSITCISRQTADDICEYTKIDLNKLQIIPNPLGKEFVYTPHQLNSSFPTILHIGLSRRKNLQSTIKALKGCNCKLRIIGKLSDEYKKLLADNNIDYSSASNLTDEEIVEEYKKCDIVSFPSLYEGFGMPIIEAQAVGRPVVTSNLQPMNDVAGHGAITINPKNIEDVKQGFEFALTNYDTVVSHGLENIKKFSLEEITKKHFQNYIHLLNTH